MLTKLTAVFAVLLLANVPPKPDEGQWLPPQIRKMDWSKLRERGMRLTKDEFWHPEKGGVLTAAVQINGCSASFVSKEGLVITNHHCGFGAIQRLSSVKSNYVRDGYVAKTRADELPAKNMTVRIVRRIVDVTDKVKAVLAKAQSPIERFQAEQRIQRQLINQEQAKHKDTECSISSFFEGRQYLMYYRTLLTDVRLVYAPPRSIGEYGGEVDNWEWPRHTGDFCLFRAYAKPDGTPRKYHKDNVPYQPKHILKVSRDGVQDGDLVIIMGYPGRTERYLTSEAVQDRQSVFYPLRYDLFTKTIDILHEASKASAAKKLELSSLIKSLANVEKNALGMIKGLAWNAVVDRKLREEKQFTNWVNATAERRSKYGKVLSELMELDSQKNRTTRKDLLLGLTLSRRLNPLMNRLMNIAWWLRIQQNNDKIELPKRLAGGVADLKDLGSVQLPLLGLLFDTARDIADADPSQRINGTQLFEGSSEENPSLKVLKKWLEKSPLRTAKGRRQAIQDGYDAMAKSQDPLARLAVAMADERGRLVRRNAQISGRRLVVGPQWIEAQQQWRGRSFYPDANSTMRVSIASVKGYSPRDGVHYKPHTTVKGLLAKNTGKDPFDAPKLLVKAAKNRQKSRYFDWRIGDVPVCFLSDGDTTGGNSGSPVINGRGELVGLNFDRVFENVSGDYGWNPDRSRNISVDIRYVLWCIEQVMPAHHLLEEMGVK